ncbi:hypothetical protein ACOSQ2_031725 [Xanthoceras sorbifolium]
MALDLARKFYEVDIIPVISAANMVVHEGLLSSSHSLISEPLEDAFIQEVINVRLDVGDVILTVDCKGKPKAMELDCKFLNGNIVPGIGLMGFLITLVCYCPMSTYRPIILHVLTDLVVGGRGGRLLHRFYIEESWVESLGCSTIVDDNWLAKSTIVNFGRVTQSISSCAARLAN